MNADDQQGDGPDQPKSQTRSGPEFLGLTRCAACYNQRASRSRWGGDGESSSSAEDSGPEADPESEAESTSSSSSSSSSSAEAEPGDVAEPGSVVKDAGGHEEPPPPPPPPPPPESREDKTRLDVAPKRAPLVRSSSLPGSLTHLLPWPPTVVSTLRLQVLPQNRHDALCIVRQQEEGAPEGTRGTGDPPLPPPAGLPWQQGSRPTMHPHQLSHQCHHRPQPHLPPPPPSVPGQRLPPPLHTHPVFPPPDAALHALSAQQCWFCHNMQFPASPYWSVYGHGRQPR